MEATVIAYARQKTLFSRMEVLANNVANSDTSGFKSDLAVYLNDNKVINGKANPVPKMIIQPDLSAGSFKSTGRPLDVAIQGDGYFQLETPAGTRFTKSGSFTINDQGQLSTQQGYILQGDAGAITLEPDDQEIRIDRNGEVTVKNNGLSAIRGQIGVVTFQNPSSLVKVGNNNFSSSEAPEQLTIDQYEIAQGVVEQSNVQSVKQITELIDVSRGVQQLAKIIDTQYQLERNAVSRIAGSN
ncbi:MAG: flagellar hook-basal body complex protein [Rickettsiales bacterium]|nr:flagellar hook-basal body complex protein [Rickettsiales bacterium]